MKPKLLYLVHRIPYPPNKGDKIRSFNFLKALATEYEIYLGTFIDDPEDEQYVTTLNTYCQACYCVSLNPHMAKLKSLRGLLTGDALSLPYYRNHHLQAWVDRTLTEQSIGHALIFSSPMAQYIRHYPDLNIVADFVDVDSDKWLQYAAKKQGIYRWLFRREAEKLLAFERRIAQTAKMTLLVSAQEAQLFQALAPESSHKIDYVNNGVDDVIFNPDLPCYSPYPAEEDAIVFSGAMDYWPNVDAVQWFAEKVFPLIKQQHSTARFYIVGSKPTAVVQQLAINDPAVIVTNRVDDVKPYIRFAKVAVAPLRIARGIQNKVLEAMALAKPVVVTSAAMEGIAWDASLAVTIADSEEDFAAQVLQNLQHPVHQALVNRQYVQQHFSWAHSTERLINFIASPRNK